MINKSKQLIEKFLDSDSKKATAIKFLLAIVIVAGVGALAMSAPGIFKTASRYQYSKRLKKTQLANAYKSLKRNKFIKIIKENGDKTRVELTNKGRRRIKEFSLDVLTIARPKKWDGKWRVLIFDIPCRPRAHDEARRALRGKIKELGFYQLQKSAWVYPYECEDEILFIAENYDVQKYIEILRVDRLLNENLLKLKFGLQ